MKAEALRDELVASSVGFAWDQWSQLGLSGWAPGRREERATDPEALLLFTLEAARNDPRLFDEVLDWLSLNERLVSVQRLRNLCVDEIDRALVSAALGSTVGARTASASRAAGSHAGKLEPLFRSVPLPRGTSDESFELSGFARAPHRPSGKSQAPRLLNPISFAFRMRRLLGVGVRAEILRSLLTIRAPRLSSRVITADAAFAQRNVRDGLLHLVEAGVIEVGEIADDRYYSVRHADWAELLALPSTTDLPLHHDWIPNLRSLTRILRWLHQPGIDDLSPYIRASQAMALVDEISADLKNAGVPLGRFTAVGPDFWDDFGAMCRTLVDNARGTQHPVARPAGQ